MNLTDDFDEIRDITVIGAGPVGLSAAFWAGMREASSRIVDSLPQIGGQLTALYPEKWIFDVPGHPRILARDLVEQLRVLDPGAQAARLRAHLDSHSELELADVAYSLATTRTHFERRAVVVTRRSAPGPRRGRGAAWGRAHRCGPG